MGRRRRYIQSMQLYELCLRARRDLPLPPLRVIRMLIKSIMARVPRDMKVEIIAHFWMSNHPHFVVLARDAQQAANFYGQVKKHLTEAIKRLLGLSHLNIWEQGGTSVIHLPDVQRVINKIAYVYLNGTEAQLESSIERYPNINSWNEFINASADVDAEMREDCPWIRQPMIPKLPARALTERQDEFYAQKMIRAAKKKHTLIIRPNAWLKAFFDEAPTQGGIHALNQEIIDRVRAREAEIAAELARKGKRPLGAKRLRQQPIFKDHIPKKKNRNIFVQTEDKELRIAIIEDHDELDGICDECFEKAKAGDHTVRWPPGTFRPPMPPIANAIV